MTLRKPREHALSRKVRKLADHLDKPGHDYAPTDARNFRYKAAALDQTIHSLGIWKEPDRIEHTNAYRDLKGAYDRYVAAHPAHA